MLQKYYHQTFTISLLLLVALILSACQPIVIAPASKVLTVEKDAEPDAFEIRNETPYGRFNGIDYVKYEGHFVDTTNGSPYNAPFQIVAPANPSRGNGRLVVEPFHYVEGAGALNGLLTPEFLFNQGFSHAAICWQLPLVDLVEEHPCLDFEGKEGIGLKIISDFAKALKRGAVVDIAGDFNKLYSIGVSNSSDPLHQLLLNPLGQDLFDLSMLLTTVWPANDNEPFALLPADLTAGMLPDESVGRVMILQSEADVILFNGVVQRDDGLHPNYRSYEVAGGQHIQGSPPFSGKTGLEFMPIIRALFMAGDRWVTTGNQPPPSLFLEEVSADEMDPVYGHPTGIARDENLNAKGGVRLPDLALGRNQFIATNVDSFILVGKAVDLTCEPLSDGRTRFADHDTYVTRFVQETTRLVDEGFLLPDDAYRMIVAAVASNVGKAGCP